RLSSAALGALVSGILWQFALILQVNSQRAIAGYSAVYSGFSAIPIFFVWMYVSWAIVLAGAELASSFQHEAVARQRRRGPDAVHVVDVLHACRHRTHARTEASPLEHELVAPTSAIADAVEDEIAGSEHNVSVRKLAQLAHHRLPGAAEATGHRE